MIRGWIRELCYIPVFGGGFGMSREEAENIPIAHVDEWLSWLRDRRKADYDALK